MLKHLLATTIFVALGISSSPASSQVFFAYPDARTVEKTHVVVGPYVAVGDNDLLRLSGYARVGLSSYLDGGIEALVETRSDETLAGLGLDLRFGVFPANNAVPFDLAINGGIGFLNGDALRIIQVPLGGVFSAVFDVGENKTVVPYAGVYLLIVDSKVKSTNTSDTDFDAEIRVGGKYILRDNIDLFASLHFGRDFLFLVGANFGL